MKRLLIGVVAVAGLLGSVLALAVSTSSPASGQQASITLQNTSNSIAAARGLNAAATSVSVTVSTVNNCNPGNRAPLSGGSYTLPLAVADGTAGATEITGLISTNCNWEISYSNPACEVSVTVKDTTGSAIGSAVVNQRPIVLSGTGATNTLTYSGSAVGSIEFAANIAGAGGLLAGSTSATAGMRCVSSFASSFALGAGNGGITAGHAGLQITATYTSSTPGCVGGTLVNRVTAAGALEFVSASPARAQDGANPLNGVSLISETVAQKGTAAPTAAQGDRCIYTVAVTDTIGNLRIARTTAGTIDGSKTTNRVDGITTAGTAVTSNAGSTATDTIPADVTITYETYTIPVVVTATFPSDEVFTTEDRVQYSISLDSPCGGFRSVIPSGFGTQGDSATSQVFPGSVTVYGAALGTILNPGSGRTFSVRAFADPQGNRACSVTVTEQSGPERCEPVGGAVQRDTVTAGAASLAFEFTHTCEPTAAASGGEGTGAAGSGNGPPAPPAINLGEGGSTDSGTSTTTPGGGPMPEGRTG